VIIAFSTSSPWTSVAIFNDDFNLIASDRVLAPMRASEACLTILERLAPDLSVATLFVADLGPGSFTGVRVGVTLAKTLAFAKQGRVSGATSFDLIALDRSVALPSKKGEYFVRAPGQEPVRMIERPDDDLIGFGPWFEGQETFPDASRFAPLLSGLKVQEPEALIPAYLIEPSITLPKQPYQAGGSTV